ncbi:MAG: hypothetical protein WBA39_26920 [Rivularia sp. (in: cyanobacteria)]
MFSTSTQYLHSNQMCTRQRMFVITTNHLLLVQSFPDISCAWLAARKSTFPRENIGFTRSQYPFFCGFGICLFAGSV